MLERKRLTRQYSIVPGAEDLELGEGVGEQETGTALAAAEPQRMTGDEELDNWDEHADDDPWDEEEHATGTDSAEGDGPTPSASSTGEEVEGKKRPE